MRAEMRGFAALLLCFAAVAAAGLQLQMRLTGVMRWGCPVTRVEFECDATPAAKIPGVPVAMHSIMLWRLAAWSGALASDMCKRRRVASSYSRCGPDMACLGGSVICNLRRQRQWHPGIASAVLCTSRDRNSRLDWTLATNHDDNGSIATIDIMGRCAQRNNGISRQRDQKRQRAVVRSGTKPQTRYGYESSGAESHVPGSMHMSLPDNGLVGAEMLLISELQ
jgi:hypothetical protein